MVTLVLYCLIGGYNNTRTNKSSVFGISILTTLIELMMTIFYLPFIDVFISMLNCKFNSNGILIH